MENPVGQEMPQQWRGETIVTAIDGQHGAEGSHWCQQHQAGQGVGDNDSGPWQQRQRQQDSRTTWQQQDSTTAWQQQDCPAMRQQEEDSPIWQHRHTQHWQQLRQRYWQMSQQQKQQRRWQQQQVLQQLVTGQQQRGGGRREAVKRSCSSLWSGDEEKDSDEEEALPSSKRQRVSVSDMERLFAAFSLGGGRERLFAACSLGGDRARGDCAGHQAKEGTNTGESNSSKSRQEGKRQRGKMVGPTWSTGAIDCSDTNQEAQDKDRSEEEVGREQSSSPRLLGPLDKRTNLLPKSQEVHATPENKDGDIDGPPTTEHEADSSSTDVDDRGMTALKNNNRSEDNNSSEEGGQETGQKITECSSSEFEKQRAVSRGKRSAEEEEEEQERDVQHNSEVVAQHTSKRVRKLKRGLRLCSNITCYIEQVLYNC